MDYPSTVVHKNCFAKRLAVSLAVLGLAACGGGGGGSSSPAPAQPAVTYSLTGSSVAPVPEGIVLEDGKGSTVALAAGDTSFKFADGKAYLAAGTTYSVKVKEQPKGYACTLDRSSAAINSNVNDVILRCNGPLTTTTYSTYIGNRDASWGYETFSLGSDGSAMVIIASELMHIDTAGVMHRPVLLDHASGVPIENLTVRRVVVGPSGLIYVAIMLSNTQSKVLRLTPTATADVYMVDELAALGDVAGMAADASDNVYVADRTNKVITKISNTGSVAILAGSGVDGRSDGTGSAASFEFNGFVQTMALDANGNLYVSAQAGDRSAVRKITPAGVVTTTVVSPNFSKMTADKQGNLYFVATTSTGVASIVRVSPANVSDVLVSRGAVNFGTAPGTYKFNAIGYISDILVADGYIYASATNPIAIHKIKIQ
jgi:hypothetical protein